MFPPVGVEHHPEDISVEESDDESTYSTASSEQYVTPRHTPHRHPSGTPGHRTTTPSSRKKKQPWNPTHLV